MSCQGTSAMRTLTTSDISYTCEIIDLSYYYAHDSVGCIWSYSALGHRKCTVQ